MISDEMLQSVLDRYVSPALHADSEMLTICHTIATTEEDLENNPQGDAVPLDPDDPDEPPYYKSARMLLLETLELDIGERDSEIRDLEIEALEASIKAHNAYLGEPGDEE
jgi:hypothetical protein